MKKKPLKQVARGRLKSMRVSGGFREFVGRVEEARREIIEETVTGRSGV